MKRGCLLETILIDIVLFVIDSTVTVVNLLSILVGLRCPLNHALTLKLFLSHLVKAILFIVSVGDDPCDQLRVNFAQIDRISIFIDHHA